LPTMINGLDTASATTWSKGLTLLGAKRDSIGSWVDAGTCACGIFRVLWVVRNDASSAREQRNLRYVFWSRVTWTGTASHTSLLNLFPF